MTDDRTAPKGVFAAVATPVDRNFDISKELLVEHCQWLLASGCDGLAPLGTTGEANSLSAAQRREVIETMAAAGIPMERTIVGTGSTSFRDAAELAEVALDAGANGLLMLPPFYYKNPAEDGLFRFFAMFAEALGARSPRIFLYHFPQMSAVPFTLGLTRRLREAFPGVFVGIKDSSGDFENTKAFIKAFPGFEAFSGSEVLAAANLDAGGWGCISATTNVTAPVVAARIRETDIGVRHQLDSQIDALRNEISSVNNVGGTKAVLSEYRRQRDWARTLPPIAELNEADGRRLAAELDSVAELRRHF